MKLSFQSTLISSNSFIHNDNPIKRKHLRYHHWHLISRNRCDLIDGVRCVIQFVFIVVFVMTGLSPLTGTNTSHALIKISHTDNHTHADSEEHRDHHSTSQGSSDTEHQHVHDIFISFAHSAHIPSALQIVSPIESGTSCRISAEVQMPSLQDTGSIFRPPIDA